MLTRRLVPCAGALIALFVGCSSSSDGGSKHPVDAGSDHDSAASDGDAATDAKDAGIDGSNPDAAPDAEPDGGFGALEISGSSVSFTEAEQQIAVAPDGTIAIAWMAYAYTDPVVRIGYRFSTDGRMKFTPAAYFSLPNGLSAIDPAITVDANGNFYASMVGAHYPEATGEDSHVYVAKAVKGSTSFGTPIEVSDPPVAAFYDHPKITTTKSGTVVVAYMQADSKTSSTTFGITARSTNGSAWQRSTIIGAQPEPIFANLFWMCEGNGILYTTYLEYNLSLSLYGVAVRSSADDGASWSTVSTFASLAGTELPAGLDPSCVASGDDVWVNYGVSTTPPTGDASLLDPAESLQVAHSVDRGLTFASRVDAMDTIQGKLALHPVLVREPTGALDLAYLSGQADLDPKATLRFVRATGAAFGPSVEVDGPL